MLGGKGVDIVDGLSAALLVPVHLPVGGVGHGAPIGIGGFLHLILMVVVEGNPVSVV